MPEHTCPDCEPDCECDCHGQPYTRADLYPERIRVAADNAISHLLAVTLARCDPDSDTADAVRDALTKLAATWRSEAHL